MEEIINIKSLGTNARKMLNIGICQDNLQAKGFREVVDDDLSFYWYYNVSEFNAIRVRFNPNDVTVEYEHTKSKLTDDVWENMDRILQGNDTCIITILYSDNWLTEVSNAVNDFLGVSHNG